MKRSVTQIALIALISHGLFGGYSLSRAQATPSQEASREELRDPSSWPAALRSPAASGIAQGADGADSTGRQIRQIVVRHGRPLVVVGGREWGVGAKLGGATIVRIEEQAVWLRDANGMRREALYPGIEKKTVNASAGAKPGARPDRAKKSTTEVSAPLQETP